METVYKDLEEAFDAKTKNIQIDTVLFDEQYLDHFTYLISNENKSFGMQMRPFFTYNTHLFNNILSELHMLEEITKLKCKNLNGMTDNFIIKTGLQVEGEDFPNTQIFILEPIATNLSEIIKYRRENKWLWTVKEFNALAKDLLNGLSALHRAGYSHNDIRPCNVYFSLEKNCYQIGSYSNALKSGGG